MPVAMKATLKFTILPDLGCLAVAELMQIYVNTAISRLEKHF